MADVKSVLLQLIKVDGINTAVIASRDGFVIEALGGGDIDAEALGAVIATGLGSSEVMGSTLEVGELSQAMMEYGNGTIMMSTLGEEAILAVVSDDSGSLGNIRFQVKRIAPNLKQALEATGSLNSGESRRAISRQGEARGGNTAASNSRASNEALA